MLTRTEPTITVRTNWIDYLSRPGVVDLVFSVIHQDGAQFLRAATMTGQRFVWRLTESYEPADAETVSTVDPDSIMVRDGVWPD